MADCSNEEVGPLEDKIRDGHEVSYNCRFHYLDVMNRRLPAIQYNTGCPTTPTSWWIELTCELLGGNYMISIKFKRMDHSTYNVKAFFQGAFLDASGREVFPPLRCSKSMIHYDDLEEGLFNISLETIRAIDTVQVTIRIEDCHADSYWQCVSGIGKASVNRNSSAIQEEYVKDAALLPVTYTATAVPKGLQIKDCATYCKERSFEVSYLMPLYAYLFFNTLRW